MVAENNNQIVIDPVCGMKKQAGQMQFHQEHQGHIVHTCSRQCFDAFNKYPDRYIQVVINYRDRRV